MFDSVLADENKMIFFGFRPVLLKHGCTCDGKRFDCLD